MDEPCSGVIQNMSVGALRLRLFAFLRARGYESRAAALVADVFVFGCLDGNEELVLDCVQRLRALRPDKAWPEGGSAAQLERELRETVICSATPPVSLPPTPHLRFIRAHKLVARLEDHGTDMTLVLSVATRTTLDRVATHGLAVVSAFGRSSVSSTVLSYFARWISLHGHIALLICGCTVKDGRFGRMRAVWGLPRTPTDAEPLVWDCSWDDQRASPEDVNTSTNAQGAGIWTFLEFLVGPLIGISPSTLLSAREERDSSASSPWGALIIALDRRLLMPSNANNASEIAGTESMVELMSLFQRDGGTGARACVIRNAIERAERRKQNMASSSVSVSDRLWSILVEEVPDSAMTSGRAPTADAAESGMSSSPMP
ncbi:hypothetical protein CCYA_CCYA03G1137 [Cyanidiococcus yangmingshanensis]|nr:hypothetical protein CCYA_CCYA03G1137 [Cyanidiococcus yangmingshanensis]